MLMQTSELVSTCTQNRRRSMRTVGLGAKKDTNSDIQTLMDANTKAQEHIGELEVKIDELLKENEELKALAAEKTAKK